MENIKFQLNNRMVEIEEQDYIFGMVFHKLYTEILVYLLDYRENLKKVEKINEKKVRKALGILKITHNLEEDMNEFIEEIKDYIFMDEFCDICDDIRYIFISAGSIIRDFFKDKNNFDICSCDIAKNIQDTGEYNLKKIYEKRLREEDSKVQNLNFEDYKKNINFEVSDDIIDAYRIGAFFEKGYDDFLNKYERLVPECKTVEDIITACELVLKLKNPENQAVLLEQFEYECIYYILLAIKDLHDKCNIPVREKYFDWNNFEVYCNTYKSQRNRKDSYVKKEELIENLLRFPFLEWQYDLILKYMGDKNLEIEKFANVFELNLKVIKRATIKKYFLELGDIDINNEAQIQRAYEDICSYREYLGYSNIEEFEDFLSQKIKEFDVMHRTVNGKLYDTLEKAEEVRSRSFEGKEYVTKEQVELVKSEIASIRSAYEDKNTLDKYRAYERLYKQAWKTEEAKSELSKLKEKIETEYQELKTNGDNIPYKEKKLKWKCIISGIIILTLTFFECSLIFFVIVFVVLILIIDADRKNLNRAKKAYEEYLEIKQRYM